MSKQGRIFAAILIICVAVSILGSRTRESTAQSQQSETARLPVWVEQLGINPSGAAQILSLTNVATSQYQTFMAEAPEQYPTQCQTIYATSIEVAVFKCGSPPSSSLALTIKESGGRIIGYGEQSTDLVISTNPNLPDWITFSFREPIRMNPQESYDMFLEAGSPMLNGPLGGAANGTTSQGSTCQSVQWGGPFTTGYFWSLDAANPYPHGMFVPSPVSAGGLNKDALARLHLSLKTEVHVLSVIYDPIIDSRGGKRLSVYERDFIRDYLNPPSPTPTPRQGPRFNPFEDPTQLEGQHKKDIEEGSSGVVNLQVTRWTLDKFPPRRSGGQDSTYQESEWVSDFEQPRPGDHMDYCSYCFDYEALMDETNGGQGASIMDLVNSGQIDEVWIFGDPTAGYCESRMLVPQGDSGYWVNCSPSQIPDLEKRVIVMGYSMERGFYEMLESYGHRIESIMQYGDILEGSPELLAHFERLDRDYPITGNHGSVGDAHLAFNAKVHPTPRPGRPTATPFWEYDRTNERFALTDHRSWYAYPTLEPIYSSENCNQLIWTCTEYGYMQWWFDHIPKYAPSGSSQEPVSNWWPYLAKPLCFSTPSP